MLQYTDKELEEIMSNYTRKNDEHPIIRIKREKKILIGLAIIILGAGLHYCSQNNPHKEFSPENMKPQQIEYVKPDTIQKNIYQLK